VAIETVPLLKQDRHHLSYEISIDISASRFEPCPDDVEGYKFASADSESISQELNSIGWASLFSCKRVDICVDLFYDVVWRCFDRHVPKSRSRCNITLPWDSKCLRILKNKSNSTAKKMKRSESQCLSNPSIDDCECESLRTAFCTARSEYQSAFHDAYDDYRKRIESSIKIDPKTFFKYVNLKKKSYWI
jgi:hypothetical protein